MTNYDGGCYNQVVLLPMAMPGGTESQQLPLLLTPTAWRRPVSASSVLHFECGGIYRSFVRLPSAAMVRTRRTRASQAPGESAWSSLHPDLLGLCLQPLQTAGTRPSLRAWACVLATCSAWRAVALQVCGLGFRCCLVAACPATAPIAWKGAECGLSGAVGLPCARAGQKVKLPISIS